MAKIAILKEDFSNPPFEGEQYVVDTGRNHVEQRRPDFYMPGDLICSVTPFFGVPLQLEIAIRTTGELVFRSWNFRNGENWYLHTSEKPERKCESWQSPFKPSAEQIETVNGLFSGRIRFEGLKLAPGGTLQDICPIDVKREEELTGRKILLV